MLFLRIVILLLVSFSFGCSFDGMSSNSAGGATGGYALYSYSWEDVCLENGGYINYATASCVTSGNVYMTSLEVCDNSGGVLHDGTCEYAYSNGVRCNMSSSACLYGNQGACLTHGNHGYSDNGSAICQYGVDNCSDLRHGAPKFGATSSVQMQAMHGSMHGGSNSGGHGTMHGGMRR